ncbi:MAG: hypothetical protein KKF12_17455 [Proteobacteria bacterium]|nr:hypothetical protein [Desulfobacula sp.]MBU4132606.1 hypothetical protein [Pseudomonadota bacterium]
MALSGTFFNATYYITQNADVAANWSGSALSHYERFGAAEGRTPNAWFNAQYYRANSEAAIQNMTALEAFTHYQTFGYAEGRATSATYANFNELAYLAANPDVDAAGIGVGGALNHYLVYGAGEGRTAVNDDGTSIASATGTSYALTTGTDSGAAFTGTINNDTFDATRNFSAAGVQPTINNADVLDGGAGLDTINIQMTASVAPTIKNIETINLEPMAGGLTLNLISGDTSAVTLNVSNPAGAASAVTNNQGLWTTFSLTNSAVGFTTTNANTASAGTADALAVTLNNVTAAAPLNFGTATAASGYETISITSSGLVANSATLTDGLGTSLATVNVAGAQNLTLALLDTTVTTVNANTMTGTGTGNALALTVAAGNTQAMTITGPAAAAAQINMNGTFTAADTITGGTATTDTLVLTNAEAIAATVNRTLVTGMDVIAVAGLNGALSVTNFNATGAALAANGAGPSTIAYTAGTSVLNLSTFNMAGNTLAATAAGTATTDVLNLVVGSAAAGNAGGAADNMTFNGFETINIVSQGGANTFAGTFTSTATAATEAINITGNQNIIFTGAVASDTINAGGMTGTATLQVNGGAGTVATTITGTANADVIIGSTAGDIFNLGAGNDTVSVALAATVAAAGDIITTGAGNDTVILYGSSASAASYVGSAQITDFTVGTTLTAGDILQLSSTDADFATASGGVLSQLDATVAAAKVLGSVVIQNIAQNSGLVAGIANADIAKLTTGVAAGASLQATFDAAIGTAEITGIGDNDVYVMMYDTTNARALILHADTAGAGGSNATGLDDGDAVALIGSIDMTAADYALFGSNNITIV